MTGIDLNAALNKKTNDVVINQRQAFRQRSLQERAAAYGGQLNLSTEEVDWGKPVEGEVW